MANKDPGDWRRRGKKAPAVGAATPAAGGGKRGWQKQGERESGPKKPWSRASKLFAALGALGLLSGLVYVMILLFDPPRPACFVCLGTSYSDNLVLPHNLPAWKGLGEFSAIPTDGNFTKKGRPRASFQTPKELTGKADEAWENAWNEAGKRFNEETIVFFLALHGATNGKEAFFHVNGPPGMDRLPLQQVFKSLEKLKNKNVVLIVEPALAASNWPTGMIRNDFVKALKDAHQKVADEQPKLVIFCACDADQTSWASEEWRTTIFSHYIVEGVKGAADGAVDGTKNARVTALELFVYVEKKVREWALRNRAVDQTPILLGKQAAANEMTLAQVPAEYRERDPKTAPGLKWVPPAELAKAWAAFKSLNEMIPHPAVYAPHAWRKYRETLLRMEQMHRFGGVKEADDLHRVLNQLRTEVEGLASFDKGQVCASRSLPLAELFGKREVAAERDKERTRDLEKRLSEIWTVASDENRIDKLFDKLSEWSKDKWTDPQLVRVDLQRAFLKFLGDSRVAGEGNIDKSKARIILDSIDKKFSGVPSAETHFLGMLLKDILTDPAPPLDLIQLVVKVRAQAERATLSVADLPGSGHPHGEVILPWILAKTREADLARRPGEDWIFGADDADWKKSRKLLDEAEHAYKEIQDEGRTHREALDQRDFILADLPYYAQWCACQRVGLGKDEAIRELEAQVKNVAKLVEALKSELDAASPNVRKVKTAASTARNEFDGLRTALWTAAKANRDQAQRQTIWHENEAILSIPMLLDNADDAFGARGALIEASREISAKFHDPKNVDKADAKVLPEPDPKARAEFAKKQAERGHQLSWAVYNLFWPKELAAFDGDSSKSGEKLAELMLGWSETLTQAAAASRNKPDVKQALAEVKEAEHLTRGLPGGFEMRRDSDPVQIARHLRMHDLLVEQARRVAFDRWSDRDELFFVKAKDDYLKVARTLAEEGCDRQALKDQRRAAIDLFDATINADGGLSFAKMPRSPWTSEKEFPVVWTLNAAKEPFLWNAKWTESPKHPPGVAMLWRELDGRIAAWTEPPKKREALPLDMFERQEFTRKFEMKKPSEKATDPTFKVRPRLVGRFRGQEISSEVEIYAQPADLIIHRFPTPKKAKVEVRMAKDFNYGAICIALDLSGSMIWAMPKYQTLEKGKPILDKNDQVVPRLKFAIDALESTLKIVPDGTYVSLVAFITYRQKPAPETFVLREPIKWEARHLAPLLDDIRSTANRGWTTQDAVNETPGINASSPIAGVLAKATKLGFPGTAESFSGPKVMLALTDGDDNATGLEYGWIKNEDFKESLEKMKDREDMYASKIYDFLWSKFNGSDIQLHFVCFNTPSNPAETDFDKRESIRAEKQFKKLVTQDLTPAGEFFITPDPTDLARRLQLALRPRLIFSKSGAIVPDFGREGLPASLHEKEEANIKREWIQPGDYSVREKNSPSSQMDIQPGDVITIALKRDGRKVAYERQLLTDSPFNRILGKVANNGEWLAGALDNSFDKKDEILHQLVCVEKPSFGRASISQYVPKVLWAELTSPKGAKPPAEIRWYREYGYAAPAYRLRALGWPAPNSIPAPSELAIWTSDSDSNPAFSTTFSRLMKNPRPEPVRLAETTLWIEGASIENREVAVEGGKLPMARRKCLVVRVDFSKTQRDAEATGPPAFIQMLDPPGGEEHHYYTEARKYTAVFWDLKRDDQDRHEFNVLFLDKMKSELKKSREPLTLRMRGHETSGIQQEKLGD